MRYTSKKRIGIFAGVLAFAGVTLLIFSYLSNILGPAELRVDILRLLVVVILLAFVAMGAVSLTRFEDEIEQSGEVKQ